MNDSYAALQGDIIALLTDSAELAALDPGWSAAQKVFEGIGERLGGQRNLGRMPFIEVGFPRPAHDELSTADYAGKIDLRLRCRLARDWSETDNGANAGEMFHRVWQTLAGAMRSGTANCPALRNGDIGVAEPTRFSDDGKSLWFEIRIRWDAPMDK